MLYRSGGWGAAAKLMTRGNSAGVRSRTTARWGVAMRRQLRATTQQQQPGSLMALPSSSSSIMNNLQQHRFFSAGALPDDLPDWRPLKMPSLSPTMEIGGVAQWDLGEGDEFDAGDVVAQVRNEERQMERERRRRRNLDEH